MPDSLVEAVTRYTNAQRGESPFATAIAGFTILRSNNEKHPSHTILKPALCVVVQGAKWTNVGTRRFQYKAGQALVVSIEIPSVSRVTEARPGRPYLAVVIEFDLGIMREVMEELDTPVVADGKAVHGIFVTNFDGALADCVLRAVRLLDKPKAISRRFRGGGRNHQPPGFQQAQPFLVLQRRHGRQRFELPVKGRWTELRNRGQFLDTNRLRETVT